MEGFKQISHDPNPSVLGVTNGVYQVEFEESSLKKNKNFNEIDEILLTFDFRKQEKVPKLIIEHLEGKLIKKAKLTDFMVFSPQFLGCNYLINQKVIECFHSAEVNPEEYELIEAQIETFNCVYYLLFVPTIPSVEIDFAQSKIFPEKDYLATRRDYYIVNSHKDYRALLAENPLVSFEQICLPSKYQERNILSVQGSVNLFFSENLVDSLNEADITNFRIPNRQIDLVFSQS